MADTTPAASPQDALRSLLTAEMAGDHDASFRFVVHAESSRNRAEWARRRNELPAVTGFTIEPGAPAGRAVALVQHEPGLDPFKGLSPARERQTWVGVRVGSAWVLEAEPSVEALFPDEARARDAATAWVRAVQACDPGAAQALQAVTDLFGAVSAAGGLCRSTGEVRVGPVGRMPEGPDTADILAQYTADAGEWARVVRVESPRQFSVVLAPIGDVWKVLGILI